MLGDRTSPQPPYMNLHRLPAWPKGTSRPPGANANAWLSGHAAVPERGHQPIDRIEMRLVPGEGPNCWAKHLQSFRNTIRANLRTLIRTRSLFPFRHRRRPYSRQILFRRNRSRQAASSPPPPMIKGGLMPESLTRRKNAANRPASGSRLQIRIPAGFAAEYPAGSRLNRCAHIPADALAE
jgi:hypothetical protein